MMNTPLRGNTARRAPADREAGTASAAEHAAIAEVEAFLARQGGQPARLVGMDDEAIALLQAVYRLLSAVVHQLALDNAVAIVPRHRQLTTQQAAGLLNISRPLLIQLLERGELPYARVGTHRRVNVDDVLAYRQRRAAAEEAALDELARDGRELGL